MILTELMHSVQMLNFAFSEGLKKRTTKSHPSQFADEDEAIGG
jgi:hypothetical protein